MRELFCDFSKCIIYPKQYAFGDLSKTRDRIIFTKHTQQTPNALNAIILSRVILLSKNISKKSSYSTRTNIDGDDLNDLYTYIKNATESGTEAVHAGRPIGDDVHRAR